MKTNEIKTAAMNVIKENSCYTCKDVKNVYPTLVETYGKDNAKAIVTISKEILKTHAVYTKANATKVIDGLKDGQRVLNSTWNSILKDKTINQFAVLVYKTCNNDLLTMINRYASAKDNKGNCAVKHFSKIEGVHYYTTFDIEFASVASCLSVAKSAIRNAKTAAIKGSYNYKVVEVR